MSKRSRTQIEIEPEWLGDADEMGVTKAEYIRRMVRAGRRQWGFDHVTEPDRPHVQLDQPGAGRTVDADRLLEDIIARNLSTTDGLTREEIVELIAADLEERTLTLLEAKKADGEVDLIPSKGGWVTLP